MTQTKQTKIRTLAHRILRTAAAACLTGVASVVTLLAPTGVQAQSQPYLGEVRAFGESFCPRGWVVANGQLMAISNNTALFSIIGAIYGGDGRSTMAVPNLMGRIAQGPGNGPGLNSVGRGQIGGAPTRTLVTAELPAHNHIVNATNAQGNKFGPGGDLLADPNTSDPATEVKIYRDGSATPNRTMDPGMILNTGGNQPIDVQSPYLALTWCIAAIGTYPSRP